MALTNLTKVQTVGIGSNIEVVGVVTTGQFKSGTSNLHSTGIELTNLNVSGIATISGNISIGGTLTYQDVTNVDSIGIVTAREGIKIPDDKYIKMGSSDDLQIYHAAGAASHINNTGLLNIDGTTGVRLEYNNTNRVYCTSTGVTLGGDIEIADKIVHEGDTNTAIRFPSADTITAETGGSERLRIPSGGGLAIGTGSPTRTPLHVHEPTTATANIHLTNSSSGSGSTDGLTIFLDNTPSAGVWFRESGALRFATGNTERLRITSAGDVGIGYDSPTVKLHVREAASGASSYDNRYHIIVEDDAEAYLGFYVPSSGYAGVRFTDNTGLEGYIDYYFGTDEMVYSSTAIHKWTTAGSERFRIGSSGQFGIGGATYGTAGQVLTSGGSGSAPTWSTPSAGVTITNNANNRVITGGSGTNLNAETTVEIDANGKMSLGATSADRLLDIHQNSTTAYQETGFSPADNSLLRIHNPSGTDNSGVGYHTGLEFVVASGANSYGQLGYVRTGNNIGDFFFKHRTGGSTYRETLRVKSDNTILLGGYQGTGSPNSNVVNENVIINCSSTDSYDNRHTVTIGQTDGNWTGSGSDSSWGLMWHYAPNATSIRQLRAGIHYDHSNTEEFKIWSAYGDIVFKGNSGNSSSSTAEQCNLELARFDANGHFVPGANNARDLGTSSKKWRNIYVMDMHFSNEGGSPNSVDGTTGNWTLQEGEDGIYMINNKNGKKYEMMLKEVQ